ncbi:hypothetical protein MPDQ_003235 [Monascus purpureus]|uniref:Uncharacterized protein n=1 Tax=Monascus purpureus TaxID=5098 RepID=A0A507QN92_MONPU|nr:hypothetical protein MPDQ_003235 [Monascus purpureus]
MSTALVMLGYDTSLLSTLYAYPSFQKKFGEKTGDDGYQVPARWQALSNSATAGVILGLICVSWLVDQYGSVSLASAYVSSAFRECGKGGVYERCANGRVSLRSSSLHVSALPFKVIWRIVGGAGARSEINRWSNTPRAGPSGDYPAFSL